MNVIIVTACPQGLATSFLAARALSRAARAREWQVIEEVHSRAHPVSPVTDDAIRQADLVIVAASAPVDLARFAGVRLFHAPVTAPLADPDAFLDQARQDATPHTPQDSAADAPDNGHGKTIVAVTACPTGVAHTFMAAEALTEAARAAGHRIRVETQGSVGAQDALTDEEIADADVVLLACDIEIDPGRFSGKRVWRTSTGNALKQAAKTLSDTLENAEIESGQPGKRGASGKPAAKEKDRTSTCLLASLSCFPWWWQGG